MGSPRRSLTEYAQEHPPGRRKNCWTCSIPERDEVDAGLRAGLMPTAIYRWLTDPEDGAGYDPKIVSCNRIDYHRSRGHHATS